MMRALGRSDRLLTIYCSWVKHDPQRLGFGPWVVATQGTAAVINSPGSVCRGPSVPSRGGCDCLGARWAGATGTWSRFILLDRSEAPWRSSGRRSGPSTRRAGLEARLVREPLEHVRAEGSPSSGSSDRDGGSWNG